MSQPPMDDGVFSDICNLTLYGIGISVEGQFHFVNGSFSAALNINSRDEILSHHWTEFFSSNDRKRIRTVITEDGLESNQSKDGLQVTNSIALDIGRLELTRLDNNRLLWGIATESTDTESQQLANYKSILTNIRDAVYTLDEVGRITWVNEVAVESFDGGYERDELIGSPVSKIMDEEDIKRCIELIQDLLKGNRDSARCEVELIAADGRTVPVDLHLTLLPSEDGRFIGTIGVARDISEQIQREQQLSVLNRVLRHNVRNDINIITGIAENLASHIDEPEIQQKLRQIEQRGNRLVKMSSKARSLEETIDVQPDTHPIDIPSLISTISSDFIESYPHVTIQQSFEDELWAIGNDSLQTAIENLIENAIIHNESAAPTVRITGSVVDDRVELNIIDNGSGIPDAELAVLKHDTETPLHHGSGIGLWLVNWIVNNLGGSLQFNRRDDRGTVAIISLPASSLAAN